jgi:four helix bundle protein
LTKKPKFRQDFGLRDQIQRASVSAMTNISEGFARYSSKEFIRFLDYTQSSCEEVKSLLYVAYDQKYINKSDLEEVYSKASDARNLTLALIKYLRNNR